MKKAIRMKQLKKIYWFKFTTAKNMAKAFMRVQEYWESATWGGKVFTNGEYKAWYREKHGAQYYDEVSGLNLPMRALVPFLRGTFNPLSKKEREAFDFIRLIGDIDYNAYFIATADDDDAFIHEMAHSLYFLYPEYREKADKITAECVTKAFKKYLKWCDYREESWPDEMQAFIVDDLDFLADHGIKGFRKAHEALRKLFNRFWKETE